MTKPIFALSVRRAVVLLGAVALVLGLTVGALAAGPSKGLIPDQVVLDDGTIDRAALPDFVPTLNQAGEEVGWVRSDAIFPNHGVEPADRVAVYADDLQTVVGHMLAGVGFVPLGSTSDDVPPVPEVIVTEESALDAAD